MREFLVGLGVGILAFFSPVFPIMIAVGVAIALDTFWGIKASIKKGKPYSSKILRIRLLNKLLKYQLAVISFFAIDKLLLNEVMLHYFPIEFTLSKLLGIALCFVEFSSINESSKVLYEKSFFERFHGFIKSLKIFKKEFDEIKD